MPVLLLDDPRPGVRRLTLNRPEKRNALNHALRGGILDALRTADADPDVRVMIVRGAGKCFSAGYELGGGNVGLIAGYFGGADHPAAADQRDGHLGMGFRQLIVLAGLGIVFGIALATAERLYYTGWAGMQVVARKRKVVQRAVVVVRRNVVQRGEAGVVSAGQSIVHAPIAHQAGLAASQRAGHRFADLVGGASRVPHAHLV